MYSPTHALTHTQTDLSALDDAQLAALDDALTYRPPAPRRPNRKTSFRRILVRKPGSNAYTTVSLDDRYFLVALVFAYGEERTLTAALRKAALTVTETRPGYFSSAVRKRALASLRGGYQPERAAALAKSEDEAAHILSDDNNAAWAAAQAECGVMQ